MEPQFNHHLISTILFKIRRDSRGLGTTTVLKKLAEEKGAKLVTHNSEFSKSLGVPHVSHPVDLLSNFFPVVVDHLLWEQTAQVALDYRLFCESLKAENLELKNEVRVLKGLLNSPRQIEPDVIALYEESQKEVATMWPRSSGDIEDKAFRRGFTSGYCLSRLNTFFREAVNVLTK